MGGQFDRKLVDKIRDTFDRYEDAGADEAWLKLLAKEENPKKRPVFLWYTAAGIAAALVLFLLIWKPEKIVETKNNIVKTKTQKPLKSTDYNKTDQREGENTSESQFSDTNNNVQRQAFTKPETNFREVNNDIPVGRKTEHIVLSNSDVVTQQNDFNDDANKELNGEKEVIAQIPENTSEVQKQPQKAGFEEILKQDGKNIQAKADAKKQKKQVLNSRFRVDIGASTFVNFADGASNNNINLGVGLLSEYALSSKVSLLSGVTFARQSANFITQNTVNTLASVSDAPDRMLLTSSAFRQAEPDEVKANFVNLDIPINVKIQLPGKKTNWFLSTGVSSFLLLNEQYKYQYNISTLDFEGNRNSSVTTQTEENPNGNSTSFAFARALNLSLGITYPAGKKANLTLEPFIKYPVGGIGAQDLKIGSGGLNLKLNFSGRR